MGFSASVASVILFAAFLFFAGTIANTMLEANQETRRAEEDKRERDNMELHATVEVESGQWYSTGPPGPSNDVFELQVRNTGTHVLQVDKTALFLDGTWVPHTQIDHDVDGRTTNLWGPGQTLHLTTPSPQEPERAWLVIETGRSALWTP
jgi:archaellum component FlaF (FlaF/FlaG flagellin family)